MQKITTLEPVDYLTIGHITQDITPGGLVLGGTASFASLTARAFGLRVGIVTACSPQLELPELEGISIVRKPSRDTSTFQNTYTTEGRVQHVHHVAEKLTLDDVPPLWRTAPIVHLGPLTYEFGPEMLHGFEHSLIGVTPQGWLRGWNDDGLVSYQDWSTAAEILPYVSAAVMSIEDVHGDEDIIAEFVSLARILVVTEGASGARVYWHGDVRNIRPPAETEIDPVGAGDIFAASFFIKLQQTRDPWESARFATLVGATSVTRKGITGVPTEDEISQYASEIVR